MNLWDKQPWETLTAFGGFQSYLVCPPPRSIEAAWRHHVERQAKVGKHLKSVQVSSSWRNYSRGGNYKGERVGPTWAVRAMAYDEYMRRREEDEWIAKRIEIRKQEFDVGQQLMNRAKQMLTLPIIRQTKTEDGKTTIIEPADWRYPDIARVAESASKLQRLGADMATDKTEIISKQEAVLFVAQLADIVRNRVSDERVIREIGADLFRLVGRDDGDTSYEPEGLRDSGLPELPG